MLTFGERLRMARERAGLTQKDVYKALSITDKSLSRYENNATLARSRQGKSPY